MSGGTLVGFVNDAVAGGVEEHQSEGGERHGDGEVGGRFFDQGRIHGTSGSDAPSPMLKVLCVAKHIARAVHPNRLEIREPRGSGRSPVLGKRKAISVCQRS